jgi:hypothetical protein
MKKFPKPVVYDIWENTKYRFRFSMIGGLGYLTIYLLEGNVMLEHTISPNLKIARAEALHYWTPFVKN